MNRAARAIILEDDKILVMHRHKHGSEYFTLVGGRANASETSEQALVREVREETGLNITKSQLVFVEEHPAPYNAQDIFLCEVAPHGPINVQEASEEGFMNRLGANMHKPLWVNASSFSKLAFRTPQLQNAIVLALKKGFPDRPLKIS